MIIRVCLHDFTRFVLLRCRAYGTMTESVDHPQKRQRTRVDSYPADEVYTLLRRQSLCRDQSMCKGDISHAEMALRESAEWVSTVIEMAFAARDPVAARRAIVEFVVRTKNIVLTGERVLDKLPSITQEELKQAAYPRGVYFQFSDLPAAKLLEGVNYPRYIELP